ncbi:hypothetical protein AK812_SmicGene20432 [Symbiodinium microadriaticum]|uniref:Uncharacterized protein n=1 Tax=Symbiodinium microadriaticum TaxID=2951 RepID=A0A1Q9DQ17_SYMMI|nr:hypothetical protein AK812_SmicGene20432 [Symbiodinium microadriaticum]
MSMHEPRELDRLPIAQDKNSKGCLRVHEGPQPPTLEFEPCALHLLFFKFLYSVAVDGKPLVRTRATAAPERRPRTHGAQLGSTGARPVRMPGFLDLGIPSAANMDLEEDVSAIEEVSRANWTGDRSSLLRAARGARSFVREAAAFHVANTRFWEAVLLPCAVVVVVALSSCMELWLGQCVSLACWYSANYYTMGYTLQVLHPQVSSSTLLRLSPFGGALQLFLWSVLPALAEVLLLNVMNVPSVAHVAGTTLYAVCGCFWLHVFIAPWQCIPEGWRPHQVFRRGARCTHGNGWSQPVHYNVCSLSPDVPPEATDGSPRRRTSDRSARLVERAEGSIAGHAALAIAGSTQGAYG